MNKTSFDYCPQSTLDSFYKSLSAGKSIPSGSFDGAVQLGSRKLLKISENTYNPLKEFEESFLELLWKGKIFYRQKSDDVVLFNRIFKSLKAFPAHVYFGESLFDKSKESIIIDYSNNQDIEGYREALDWVVNETGLEVRDEIRKVNSTLYLGRAYIRGRFFLNFVLQSL